MPAGRYTGAGPAQIVAAPPSRLRRIGLVEAEARLRDRLLQHDVPAGLGALRDLGLAEIETDDADVGVEQHAEYGLAENCASCRGVAVRDARELAARGGL